MRNIHEVMRRHKILAADCGGPSVDFDFDFAAAAFVDANNFVVLHDYFIVSFNDFVVILLHTC